MTDAVVQTVARHDLLQNGDSVIVALSGGADSVALLHVLYSLKEQYNLKLYAAHLNHQLRGEEADRDEQFCKILCEKYNIPLYRKSVPVGALAAKRKISEELCGREERYRFFEALSGALHAKVATAHNADDNAETLLFHLARGSALQGAGGIPPKRGVFIRPLLGCTRAQIERYCDANGLDYVTDSTNLRDDYTRNKIRHQLTPLLRELNPRWEQAAARFCESAAQAADFLDAQAALLLQSAASDSGYAAKLLLDAHPAVRSAALTRLCRAEGIAPETRHLRLLEGILAHGGAVDLGKATAVCKQQYLRLAAKHQQKNNLEIPFDGDISFPYRDKLITARSDNSDGELKNAVFRTRRGGERFSFAERRLTKPLRKALNEQKIPAEQRDNLLLLCMGDDVLWCEALGFSAKGEQLRLAAGLRIDIQQNQHSKGEEQCIRM